MEKRDSSSAVLGKDDKITVKLSAGRPAALTDDAKRNLVAPALNYDEDGSSGTKADLLSLTENAIQMSFGFSCRKVSFNSAKQNPSGSMVFWSET